MKFCVCTLVLSIWFVACLQSVDDKKSSDSVQNKLNSGVWEGYYADSLYISFILRDDKAISRTDLLYHQPDGDVEATGISKTAFGPFSISDESVIEFEKPIKIDTMTTNAVFKLKLLFVDSKKATGTITIEQGEVLESFDLELKWSKTLPVSGPIRDGSWSGSISSPILFGIGFSTKNGEAQSGSFYVIDASRASFGTQYYGDTLRIGEGFSNNFTDFSVYGSNTWGKLNVVFDEYMKGTGTLWLDLVSEDTTLPFTINWRPEVP